ncbi:MAG: acetylornithine transaminase [Chromatiaceae bacterium]|nr:acetylornithine transaminase [Gammaproteobacteria bacterium]MCP5318761.1 acetylornithine transaminase [Chromatiaceae bacterium]MCP5429796.1 acetylornithine transaminase [Chromatiaceae bacterium]MCP5435550.1 acetylornithine transaminase [Chromatiaceae bacterium]HOP16329.1 acetylornithine transaminase [Gammaproteobacteria bacterium]
MSHSLMSTYKRLPVTFARGEGALLWDTQDKQYLDALSGVAVCNLGHAHPAVTKAVCEQAGRLLHTSNIYGIAAQETLGDTLTALAGMDRVFFGNSGAEANEAAIKLARLYGHRRGNKSPMIVVMENSFHGRTLATLSATGNRKVQAGFEPLVQGFIRVPYGDLAALQAVADNQKDVVAVLVEPIQGEGGVNVPPPQYLPGVRALCDNKGWLMILDEIQTGMGRTGKPFAYQHYDFKPDVMTLAKALGNGVPIGACLARGDAAELFAPGNHGSTFGGNPLACAAALTVCRTLSEQKLWDTAASLGESIRQGLRNALDNVQGVIEVRGQGLMIGIALDRPCAELVARALEQGLLINVTADSVVRLLPPLVMTEQQADHLVSILSSLLREFLAGK